MLEHFFHYKRISDKLQDEKDALEIELAKINTELRKAQSDTKAAFERYKARK